MSAGHQRYYFTAHCWCAHCGGKSRLPLCADVIAPCEHCGGNLLRPPQPKRNHNKPKPRPRDPIHIGFARRPYRLQYFVCAL